MTPHAGHRRARREAAQRSAGLGYSMRSDARHARLGPSGGLAVVAPANIIAVAASACPPRAVGPLAATQTDHSSLMAT